MSVSRTAEMLVMSRQNNVARIMPNPKVPFKTILSIMDRGTTMEAFCISSDI